MICYCEAAPERPATDHTQAVTQTVTKFSGTPVDALFSNQFLSSILHELQQPLVAIKLFAAQGQRSCGESAPSTDALHSHFEGIYDSAMLTLKTIAQLRRLVNGQAMLFELVDINNAVAEIIHLAEIVGRARGISIVHSLEPDLDFVLADRVSFQHAVLNLLFNGIEAIDGQQGGRVTIRTRSAADTVEIAVADTGSGIAEAIRGKLFEPHFTTKPEGSGLGLAIARSIVEEHGGTIDLARAKAGEGATFRLRLPSVVTRPEGSGRA